MKIEILVRGRPASGKTHIALLIEDALRARGLNAVFDRKVCFSGSDDPPITEISESHAARRRLQRSEIFQRLKKKPLEIVVTTEATRRGELGG